MSKQTTFTSVLRLGLAAAALLVLPLAGQEYRATITGTVTDPSGAAVPNAQIEVQNVATAAVAKAETNDVGAYTVPSSYRARISSRLLSVASSRQCATVNRFIAENKVKKVVSVNDTTTTDNTGATIGLIRVLTYET